MVDVSKRKLAYWACFGVYVVGVLGYMFGMTTIPAGDADIQPTDSDVGKVSVSPPQETPDSELVQVQSPTVPLFSVKAWVSMVIGVVLVSGAIWGSRYLKQNRLYLQDEYIGF